MERPLYRRAPVAGPALRRQVTSIQRPWMRRQPK